MFVRVNKFYTTILKLTLLLVIRSPATECNDAGCINEVSILTGSLLDIVMYLPLGVRFTLNKFVRTGDHPLTIGCDGGLDGDELFLESSSGWTITLVALTKPLSLNAFDKLNDFDGFISEVSVGDGYDRTNGRGAIRCNDEVLRWGATEELLLLLPPDVLRDDQGLGGELAGGRFSYIG